MTTQAELLQHGFNSTVITNRGDGRFVNSQCAVINDLVFGLCVWEGHVWTPMSKLDLDDILVVKNAIAAGGHFMWHDKLDELIMA